MNFLLEFVSCCGTPSRRSISTASPPSAEERRSLVISPLSRQEENGRYRRRKRGRFGAQRSGSAAEWRPSLYAISEDNVSPVKEVRTAARSERIVKRKVAPTARTHVQSHRDDFGQTSLPTIIPAFSATPFLF